MPLHRDSTLENIHRHHRWEVNNQAGLDALVPDALDIHKVAYKKDDDTYHVLKSVSPAVWVQTAYTKAKVDELLELKQDILTEGAFIDGDKTKLDNIEDGATADQTASEIKTAYESNDDTNALTDSLLALLTTKKVKNVTTDAVNDKLVITYTDNTVANLNINDIVTDVHVSGATLDATTNVLTLTSTDGGADVTVDLSDFVNSGELTSALSGKADNIHSHSTSDITGLDTTLSNLTTDLSDKQEILVSGTNIKTINGQSVLGSGDITISDATTVKLTGNQTIAGIKTFSSNIVGNVTGNSATATKLETARTINGVSFDGSANITVSDNTKQDTLVSGTNINTINSSSILGSGNLALLTSTNPAITGSITEQVYNLTGTEINPTNGTIQYKTVSANTTFTESLTSGQSVILRLIGANGKTITFPTITWVGAAAPKLTANCAIVLWKEQSILYGAYVGSLV